MLVFCNVVCPLQSHDNIKLQKYFCKGLSSKLVEEVFVIKKVKNNVPRAYVISVLKGEELVTFYEIHLQNTNQTDSVLKSNQRERGKTLCQMEGL